jgi:hypothetical protein
MKYKDNNLSMCMKSILTVHYRFQPENFDSMQRGVVKFLNSMHLALENEGQNDIQTDGQTDGHAVYYKLHAN